MNVILTCAFPHPGYELPHRVLEAAGLSTAANAPGQDVSPAALHDRIVGSRGTAGVKGIDSASILQLVPGTSWRALASELFRANDDHAPWGWVESRLIYLLDFWHTFDPGIGFLLAYDTPAAVIGDILRGRQVTETELTAVLSAWCGFNAELLRFHYANRERCLLVNSASLREAPDTLVALVVQAFQVDLTLDAAGRTNLPTRAADARLLEYLAQELLRDKDEARTLYEELESTADLPVTSSPPSSSAWNDYAAIQSAHIAELRTQSDRTEALVAERAALADACRVLEQEVETLAEARADQTKLAEQSQRQVEALNKSLEELGQRTSALSARTNQLENDVEVHVLARAEQARLAAERLAQIEALNVAGEELERQRSALNHRRRELEKNIEMLVTERSEQSRLLTDCRSQLASAQAASPAVEAELAETKAHSRALAEENELLLLQLHQVEGELERYYLENRQLLDAARSPPPSPVAASEFAPVEVLYDLRQEIDGENWYYAEHDGRWAGPELRSTLRVPALPAGHYRLQLCIVDAMEPEILAGMSLAFNDIPLTIGIPNDDHYPTMLQADFSVVATDMAPVWRFVLGFSKVVSPAERGSDDQRHLAIRVASLSLRVLDDSAPWSRTSRPIPWWAFWKRRR